MISFATEREVNVSNLQRRTLGTRPTRMCTRHRDDKLQMWKLKFRFCLQFVWIISRKTVFLALFRVLCRLRQTLGCSANGLFDSNFVLHTVGHQKNQLRLCTFLEARPLGFPYQAGPNKMMCLPGIFFRRNRESRRDDQMQEGRRR